MKEYEYDLFLPLTFNDGEPIEARFFKSLRLRLLEQFDALTYFPQANEGFGEWLELPTKMKS